VLSKRPAWWQVFGSNGCCADDDGRALGSLRTPKLGPPLLASAPQPAYVGDAANAQQTEGVGDKPHADNVQYESQGENPRYNGPIFFSAQRLTARYGSLFIITVSSKTGRDTGMQSNG